MSNSIGSGGSQELKIGPDEIGEILRSFEESGWTGMHLTVGGVTVSVGKDAPPPEIAKTSAAAAVSASPVPTAQPVAASPLPAAAPASVAPAPSAAVPTKVPDAGPEPSDEAGLIAVTAPTVGSFWVAPDPGSPPFVEVGSRVEVGDQLAIVEVMKLMSPVVSEVAGVIAAVRARNADMVEFGQQLFLIRPDDQS